jgi:YnbE-like lipoprotein
MIFYGERGRPGRKHRIIRECHRGVVRGVVATAPTRKKETHVTYSIGLPSLAVAALVLAACQPTVRVEAPKEPITINLNIKLDADIRVKLEETAKKDIESNPDIF